jgi:hypothetical protein
MGNNNILGIIIRIYSITIFIGILVLAPLPFIAQSLLCGCILMLLGQAALSCQDEPQSGIREYQICPICERKLVVGEACPHSKLQVDAWMISSDLL